MLDEPTASFHSSEVERLFAAVRRVARAGAGVLFISHRLDEIRAIADRVIVLRDGRAVLEVDVARGRRRDAGARHGWRRPGDHRRTESRPSATSASPATGLVGHRLAGLCLRSAQGRSSA